MVGDRGAEKDRDERWDSVDRTSRRETGMEERRDKDREREKERGG